MDKEISSGLASSWERTIFGGSFANVGLQKKRKEGKEARSKGYFQDSASFPHELMLRDTIKSQHGRRYWLLSQAEHSKSILLLVLLTAL